MKKIKGTKNRPRMSVHRSNKHIYVQVIDDEKAETIVAANSLQLRNNKGSGIDVAQLVGEKVAAVAKKKGIKRVKFDRSKHKYHGRVKQLAEGARRSGLEF